MAVLLFEQMVGLFLLMGLGMLLVKLSLLKSEDAKTLSVICIYLIAPCCILKAFQIDYSTKIASGFLLAVLAAVLIHLLLFLAVWILGRIFPLRRVEKASLIYSNAGNLILPLVMALLGDEWIIYASGYMCVQNVFVWTHGVSLMRGESKVDWKKIVTNVNLIAVVLGAAMFFTGIRLPSSLESVVSVTGASIGPIAMIMVGMILASVDWKKTLLNGRLWLIVALKMVVLPLLCLCLLKFSPLSSLTENGETILLISLLAEIAPSAATVTQLSQLYDREPAYASSINAVTTLIALLTMPLLTALYQL